MQTLLALTAEEIEERLMIDPQAVISVIKETLKYLDPRLIEHGDRVSFIVHELMCQSGRYTAEEINALGAMAFFHDVGAYKTEEIDRMVAFETTNVWQHSIYGYLFLKYFAPAGTDAEAVLYHHLRYSDADKSSSAHLDEAMLLHICDRLDILVELGTYREGYFEKHRGGEFAPWAVDLMEETLRERNLCARLKAGEYREVAQAIAMSACSTTARALDYLMMLVHIIDFKSPATVTHTINTVAYSVLLSRLMGQSDIQQSEIYLGALLHDLGKIAVPYEILESTGRLSYSEMEIMKSHVSISYKIIHGHIREEICRIAARHHEKLDGSGYPWGLRAGQLTTSERIVAVADVMSALTGRRSYKEEYSPDRTIRILNQMAQEGKLDKTICHMAVEHYSEIIQSAQLHCRDTIAAYERMMEEYRRLLKQIVE